MRQLPRDYWHQGVNYFAALSKIERRESRLVFHGFD